MKEEYTTIQELGADVLGVSSDSLESHLAFCSSLGGCPFPLASDQDLEVARLYGAVPEAGSRSQRSIYVLDAGGIIIYKVPWFQPGNVGQVTSIFSALGFD